MEWIEIKSSIVESLKNRGLKNPNIRLNALDNIEDILKQNLPEYISNPIEMFSKTNKNEMKEKLAKYKSNLSLNDAEKSIVNEIYYRL